MLMTIRTLQLLVHTAMFKISLPPNVMTFFNKLVPTVGFDILEAFIDWEAQPFIKFDFVK